MEKELVAMMPIFGLVGQEFCSLLALSGAWLVIYNALRLPVMIVGMLFITLYVYNRKKEEHMESPKYRMMEED